MAAGEQPISTTDFEDFTYPNLNLNDFMLDDNLPAVGPPIRNWSQSSADLGGLEVLPLEIIQGLLAPLDLRSITDFRRINRRAREIVDTLPQYKAITTHARNALRGSLIIGTGKFISCETLYAKLCTAECERCGDFGSYLYLLTCTRVCFLCLSEDNTFLPLRYSHASRKFGVPRQVLDTLPHMKSIPGSYSTYSPNGKNIRNRVALVDYDSVYHAGITLHGSVGAMERYAADQGDHGFQKYNERLSLAATKEPGSTVQRPRRPVSEAVFDGRAGNPIRFVAIVRTPWLNRVSQEPEWGAYCIGCRKSSQGRSLHWRRRFNLASFGIHIKLYGNIRDGKHFLERVSE